MDIAMDISHLKNGTDYRGNVESKLSGLKNNIMQISLTEMAYMGDIICTSRTD